MSIISRRSGVHPDGYNPIFSGERSQETSSDTMQFASMLNVSPCQDKRTLPSQMSSLHANEKSIQLFSNIKNMLSPVHGIFGPYSWPVDFSLSFLNTKICFICV